uniref:Uncharacterized protein n=1 Tax=Anguilla anguilla TaxID=7936 RepID=A0A0E9UVP6_ANGAN
MRFALWIHSPGRASSHFDFCRRLYLIYEGHSNLALGGQ